MIGAKMDKFKGHRIFHCAKNGKKKNKLNKQKRQLGYLWNDIKRK